MPRPVGGCHQCSTSPSTNWCAAWSRICARVMCGPQVDQRRRVLQLVAEAERAARLVERACAPTCGTPTSGSASQPFTIRSSSGSGRLHLRRRRGGPTRTRRHPSARLRWLPACDTARSTHAAAPASVASPSRNAHSTLPRGGSVTVICQRDAGVECRARAATEFADGRDGGRRLARPVRAEKRGTVGRPVHGARRPARAARRTRCRRRTRRWFDCGRTARPTPASHSVTTKRALPPA